MTATAASASGASTRSSPGTGTGSCARSRSRVLTAPSCSRRFRSPNGFAPGIWRFPRASCDRPARRPRHWWRCSPAAGRSPSCCDASRGPPTAAIATSPITAAASPAWSGRARAPGCGDSADLSRPGRPHPGRLTAPRHARARVRRASRAAPPRAPGRRPPPPAPRRRAGRHRRSRARPGATLRPGVDPAGAEGASERQLRVPEQPRVASSAAEARIRSRAEQFARPTRRCRRRAPRGSFRARSRRPPTAGRRPVGQPRRSALPTPSSSANRPHSSSSSKPRRASASAASLRSSASTRSAETVSRSAARIWARVEGSTSRLEPGRVARRPQRPGRVIGQRARMQRAQQPAARGRRPRPADRSAPRAPRRRPRSR